ncbi:LytR/AlgR family response regulator transcription factor [Cohnella panacarvi]|uniref:LytR/AlgR family response regulator transcription factor n=1 Tax=Cohnella panacarvi TaxID=400776 RepID=UPI00047C3195|nr:response regulator [Cohnella panacarvi]
MMRTIIAEDVQHVRKQIRSLCAASDLDVIAETHSGLEFVELVLKYRPVLVILDIELEDMSGIDAALRLRELGETDLTIMFVTGSTDPYNVMMAVNEIGAYYVVKPITSDRWNIAIDKIKEKAASAAKVSSIENTQEILVESSRSKQNFAISESMILMIEKLPSKKSVTIFLTNGERIRSIYTLQQLKEMMAPNLVETIRGVLVNLRHVSGFTKDPDTPKSGLIRRFVILFRNSTLTAPLGRAQVSKFAEQLERRNRGE